ncbi:MAG: 50S ribosomal protein L10 [Candidatus Pacebacteria bacterium]|nr:50S ribosomal protein L10 [Candidatus Paceibacterota bacterium]
MPLNKAQKQKILDDIKDKVAKQKAMVLVGITGLKVKDISELRKKIRETEGNLKVAKKTLIEKVFKESKLDFDKKNYKEEIALVFGFKDEMAPAKIVYQFSVMNDKLKILGGFLEGQFKSAEEVKFLAQLPTKKELLAQLVGSISAPVSNLVYALNYNIKGLVYLLSAIKK